MIAEEKPKFVWPAFRTWPRTAWIKLLLALLVFAGVFALYQWQGNTTDIRSFGRSTFAWMFTFWRNDADYQSQSWLIPWVSLALIWWRRREIAAETRQVNRWGLALIVLALMMHWLGSRAQEPRISLIGLILLLWSLPLYWYGWGVARWLIFPCAYLIFCIPLSFLETITMPLRMMATTAAVHVLNGIGLAYQQIGSSLILRDIQLQVAPACSGLNSILSMTAITAVYACTTQDTLLKQWTLFICSVPLAVLGNVARIVTVAMVAALYDQRFAVSIYHDYSGFIFFPIALAAMVGVGALLQVNYREKWRQWKHTPTGPM